MTTNFQNHWTSGSIIAFDESIYQYQPISSTKKKYEFVFQEPIPVVYIPRKPHPNGLLNWICVNVSSTTGLPFVMDMEPHLSFPQISARDALKKMFRRWIYPNKPSYIADAACGSFELMEELDKAGATAVFSMSVQPKP